MKKISISMCAFLLFACDTTQKNYPINNAQSSDGQTATECGTEGVLAMSAAPVVIESKVKTDCGETSFQVKTVIVSNDQAHAMATFCDENIQMELYYSTDKQAIDNLTGDNLTRELPSNVGRLVNKFSTNRYSNLMNEYYVGSPSNYSVNRMSFDVKLPPMIIDLRKFQKEFTSDRVNASGPIALAVISAAPKLRNGQMVYYRWAKYIRNESDEDILLFDKTTQSVAIELALEVELSSPFLTIDLAQDNKTILNAKIIGDENKVHSVRWRYFPINFGPETPPVIKTPFEKTTEVEFKDFGKHAFEFEIIDDCGNTITDTINILVKGQFR